MANEAHFVNFRTHLRDSALPCQRINPDSLKVCCVSLRCHASFMSSVGFASNLIIGRLGHPDLEHKVVVRVGVANVLFGGLMFSLMAQWDLQSCLRESEGFEMASPCVVMTPAVFGFMAFGSTVIMLATHVMAFPLWARLAILMAGTGCYLSLEMALPHEVSLLTGSALFGDAVGYTLNRGAREGFSHRQREKAAAKEREREMQQLQTRNEQLQCEKERVNYERQLAEISFRSQVKAAFDVRSTAESTAQSEGSCEELKVFIAAAKAVTPVREEVELLAFLSDDRAAALWRTLRDAQIEVRSEACSTDGGDCGADGRRSVGAAADETPSSRGRAPFSLDTGVSSGQSPWFRCVQDEQKR